MPIFKKVGLILAAAGLTCSCQEKSQIVYKQLKIQNEYASYISVEMPYVNSIGKNGENIFYIGKKGIWIVNLKLKTERFLLREGIGPDEVFNPYRIVRWKNQVYVNSYYPLNYIIRISNEAEDGKTDRVTFETPLDFDDFAFISDNLVVMANVNWEAGFVRFYDFISKSFFKTGNSKITDIMLKFNVNRASLCILGDKIYVLQSIKPEIQVISIKEKKFLDSIFLSPPFYQPIPKRYTVKKYDDKGHRKWMAGWTSIFDLLGKDNWLLVIYRWGYDQRYCYELINLSDVDNRFFIGETALRIYDFIVEKDHVDFDALVYQEESVEWKRAKAYFH